jgi:hypothetical protein
MKVAPFNWSTNQHQWWSPSVKNRGRFWSHKTVLLLTAVLLGAAALNLSTPSWAQVPPPAPAIPSIPPPIGAPVPPAMDLNNRAPGAFAHLNTYAGTWKVREIFNDPVLSQRLSQDFRLQLPQLLGDLGDEAAIIDVIGGQLMVMSKSSQDPCQTQTFLSISLLADESIYLSLLRNKRMRVWHEKNRVVQPNLKQHVYPRPVAQALRKMVSSCKKTLSSSEWQRI